MKQISYALGWIICLPFRINSCGVFLVNEYVDWQVFDLPSTGKVSHYKANIACIHYMGRRVGFIGQEKALRRIQKEAIVVAVIFLFRFDWEAPIYYTLCCVANRSRSHNQFFIESPARNDLHESDYRVESSMTSSARLNRS